jgi:RNA polymerase sigma factor (sigma-70 family)
MDPRQQESAQAERKSQVESMLGRLEERERQIIRSRFGLTREREPLSLNQVGTALGVTKERVRQIQCKAMNKLKMAAEED